MSIKLRVWLDCLVSLLLFVCLGAPAADCASTMTSARKEAATASSSSSDQNTGRRAGPMDRAQADSECQARTSTRG